MPHSKNNILNTLRNASTESFAKTIQNQKEAHQQSFFPDINKPLIEQFQLEFEAVNGQFHYCQNIPDLISQMALLQKKTNTPFFCTAPEIQQLLSPNVALTNNPAEFQTMKAAVTTCNYLVARTGSIVATSKKPLARQLLVYPPIHLVIAYPHQVVPEISDAINAIIEKNPNTPPSLITTITGPSRTADIEKTLILGAHGPKQLHVFFVNQQ